MSIEVAVIRDGYTPVTQCEPAVWSFYDADKDEYHKARPVGCWRDERGEWIEAHTNVSKSTGRQYVIKALWVEAEQEWVIQSREVLS